MVFFSCRLAAQFIIAKCWKQPKCPSVNEWVKNYGTFTRWNIMQQKERRSSYPLRQHGMELESTMLRESFLKEVTFKDE